MKLEYHRPQTPPLASGNWVIAAACIIAGVIVPAISFAVAFGFHPLSPEWQNGEPNNYVKLQLEGKVAWPFFPLLIYSMICMVAAQIRSAFLPRAAMLLGLCGGIVLFGQYSIILLISLEFPGQLIFPVIAAVSIGLVVAFRTLVRHPHHRLILAAVVVCGLTAMAALATYWQGWPLAAAKFLLALAGLGVLGCGPMWAFVAYLYSAARYSAGPFDRQKYFRLSNLLWPLGWLGTYAAAWDLAVDQAIQAYATLPMSGATSHCYVCTAAARGHWRFVGAQEIRCDDGTVLLVNDQLRCLKCAEIVLATLLPAFHRFLRRLYNRLGPILAARLKHPIAADLAYLSLKPAEWLSRALLPLLLKNPTEQAKRLL